MAATAPNNLYLSPDQQDLLLAALTSNSSSSPMFNTSHHKSNSSSISPENNPRSFAPPVQASPHHVDSEFPHGTPLLAATMDYADWDGDFENDGSWDYDLAGDMMNDSPSNDGDTNAGEHAHRDGEKRKEHPHGDNGEDPHDTDPKRRDDKDTKSSAKKPGRKPLTSEPTSKRKAQNRAAQRAFRERKERHLKDLEQKVEDLEKASETTVHENSVLRAQVDRLQTELREYKRRLHTSELSRTSSSLANMSGFQFDFPPFGSGVFGHKENKEGGSLMDRMNSISPIDSRSSSKANILAHGATDLFSPSILDTVNKSLSPDYMGSLNGTPKLNGGHDTTSSPSASSVSQHGPGSSCGTSPEPMNNSPVSTKPSENHLKPICEEGTIVTTPGNETYVCKSGSLDGETESTFCEKLGMACGNPHNPIPKVPQFSTSSDATASSLDWLTQQSSNNQFDPVLFSDYRDPVNDISSNIGLSFFEDAFPAVNFDGLNSPAEFAKPQTHPKKNLIAEIDALNNDDDDEVVPADDPKKMLSCNKIWDRISSHPRFVSGELDMDGLCSELRSKAKCSEVGVVVAENDVQEVLGKVGMSHKDFL